MGGTRVTGRFVAWTAALLVLATVGTAQAGGAVIYHTGEDVFEVSAIGPDVAAGAVDQLIQGGLLAEEDRVTETASMTAELTPLKLGYRCSIFGLFYAYFWWSGCELVFYKWTGASEFEYMPVEVAKFRAHVSTQASDEEEVNVQVAIHQAVIAAMESKAGKKLAEAYPVSAIKMGFWKKNGRWILALVVVLAIVGLVAKKVLAQKAAAPPPGYPPGASPGSFGQPPGAPPGAWSPPAPPAGGGFPPQPGA